MEACPRDVLLSGRRLLRHLENIHMPRTGAEADAAAEHFAALRPFDVGMSEPEVEAAARLILRSFAVLPSAPSGGPFAAHRVLLDKLPDSFSTIRQEEIRKMYESDIMGDS
eukprot:scaffold255425_cov19-Tisochrysis_lutea.AAC.1